MLAPFRQLFRQKSPRRSAFGGIHLHSSNVRDVRFVLQIQWVTELTNTQAHLRKESNWWPRAESNHRHKDFQSSALPTELLGRAGSEAKSAALFGKARIISSTKRKGPLRTLSLYFATAEITCPCRPCRSCRACRGRGRRPSSLPPAPQPSRRW